MTTPPTSTPWVPLWPLGPATALGEIGKTDIPASVPVNGTNVPVVTLTVTTDGGPINVEFYASSISPNSAANHWIRCDLEEDGVNLGAIVSAQNPGGGYAFQTPAFGCNKRTPAAGSHTYRVLVTTSGSDGSINVNSPTSPGFLRVSRAAPAVVAYPGASIPPTYGTNLPSSPLDGQEAILVDSLTAPKYQWRFRWNAGASGANKWEYVGGAPFAPAHATSTAIAASGWTGVGPTFTIPRTGDYLAQVSGFFSGGTAAGGAVAKVGDEANKTVAEGYVGGGSGQASFSGQGMFSYTAADVVQFRVRSSVALNLTRGACTLTPLRVA